MQNTIVGRLVLNVKHYVITLLSSRWQERVTSTGLKDQSSGQSELAEALIEWGRLKLCVCACLSYEAVISHQPVCVALLARLVTSSAKG